MSIHIWSVIDFSHIYTVHVFNCSSSTPEQWEDFSNKNILDADKQSQNSAALRSIVDGILQTTSNDMRRQKEITDVALADRIAETRSAKEKLEDHLAKVDFYHLLL